MVSEQTIASAERLFEAFEQGVPMPPLTADDPELTVDYVYEIHRRRVRLHPGRGRKVVGRKIGLTSTGIQHQLGVDPLDYGVILDDFAYESGSTLSRSNQNVILPRIEGELAFVLARPTRGPGVTAGDVREATSAVMPRPSRS